MIRINLFPVPKVRRLEGLIIQAAAAVVVLGFVAVACYLVTVSKKTALVTINDEIRQKDQAIKDLQAQVGEVDRYKEKAKSLEKQISVIRNLEKGRTGPVRLMDELTEIVPRRIWVTTFKEANKSLNLEGVAESGAVVADFLDNLKTAKYFQDVQLEDITAQDVGGNKLQKFKMKMKIRYDL